MNDSERMAKLLLELQIDAQTMGRSIGKRGGDIIRNVLTRRNNLSVKLASAISAKYHVSYKWLMTGEGEMFQKEEIKSIGQSKSDNPSYDEKERIIKLLLDRVEEQSQTIKIHEKCIEELTRREAEKNFQDSG